MKTFRITGAAIFALAVLLSLSAITAGADGQTGDSPFTAPYIDNASHTIQANSAMWFRFDYDAGDRAVTDLTLVDGNKNGLGFEVWTPDAVTDLADNKPVGRGTVHVVECGTGVPSAQGECETNDLTWAGAFGAGGTYYIKVINNNNDATTALLTIQGTGVSLGPPTTTLPSTTITQPTPSPAPASPPATAQNIDDPAKAVPIDNAQHNIAANSAMWLRFDYSPTTDTGDRIAKTVTLVNGNHSGVRFEVWTPDHLNDWWDNQKPVGRGTAYMMDCDTGQPSEQGQCESNDLTWIGGFNTGGTYYVRVVNDNTQPMIFTLTIN